jgi:predicted nucleic acid-binding protein
MKRAAERAAGDLTAGNSIAKKLINVASFIDSNILIYAEATDLPAKQTIAMKLLRRLKLEEHGVVSTQVLQKYCNVAIRKLQLNIAHVRNQLRSHEQFEVVQVTPAIIQSALDLHQTRSLSFYDAIILQAAITSGCDTLYSEDLNAGEIMNGVRIVNPFAA